MTTAAVASAFLASNWLATNSLSGLLGQAMLISVAAVVLGYAVAQLWPKSQNPSLFGFLAAASFVGGLAATGVTAATVAIVMILMLAVLALSIGLA